MAWAARRPALRVGVVGAGNISGPDLGRCRDCRTSITAVADLDADRAAAAAPAPGHAPAAERAVHGRGRRPRAEPDHPGRACRGRACRDRGGKHVYGEKPLARHHRRGPAVLEAAERAGVRVGCAPDTVLGTGIQTARAVLDAGDVGGPVAATAFMVTPGHERWHPAPEFYYRPGGGPLLDMGPYYLTALVTLLGPVKRVAGMSATPRPTRVIGSGPGPAPSSRWRWRHM